MDKKGLSERDICTKFITPALEKSGWNVHTQIRENVYLTQGRVVVRGKLVTRGKARFADYVLSRTPNLPLAIIEAKDNNHGVADGIQQALGYAEMLHVPFVYSSNGDGFLEHDLTGTAQVPERLVGLDQFPSPDELWRRYCDARQLDAQAEAVVTQDYYADADNKAPRYYQVNAINRVLEAVVKGQQRILLVMATGTGKTLVAFQIIWRLWKAGVKKRILFLADRNILVDQTRTNDFKPFGGAMTKITNRKVDKSYEVYLALYQAISGTEDTQDIFKQFSSSFFDLVVVDECHRGSASDNSAWRKVLEYFSSATQLGLTATPKETSDVSTSHYFGEPVYSYSLKQGINDGFLAPYKVIQYDLDKDIDGWEPDEGQLDKNGLEIEQRVYNQIDFDRTLVLEKRTELVAKKVTEFLKATDRMAKTIVFCEDVDHAERMRVELINENADIVNDHLRYIMRITGDETEGKLQLEPFISPEAAYPVIVTTSKLLSTGVDTQPCKVIVLDQTIRSMTEFKQIIGRGTRIREDCNKLYFTILDFKRATELFADPAFDGLPVQIYQPNKGDPAAPPDGEDDTEDPTDLTPTPDTSTVWDGLDLGLDRDGANDTKRGRRVKYVVADVPVLVVRERVHYRGKDGTLITESLRDYSKKAVVAEYSSLEDFLKRWNATERKQAIVDELEHRGVFFTELKEEVGRECAAFDLICHVAYGQPPLTRQERANNVRKRNYFSKYGEVARAVLETLLTRFADEGVEDLGDVEVLKLGPLTKIGTPMEIVKQFGGKHGYLKAVRELEAELYGSVINGAG